MPEERIGIARDAAPQERAAWKDRQASLRSDGTMYGYPDPSWRFGRRGSRLNPHGHRTSRSTVIPTPAENVMPAAGLPDALRPALMTVHEISDEKFDALVAATRALRKPSKISDLVALAAESAGVESAEAARLFRGLMVLMLHENGHGLDDLIDDICSSEALGLDGSDQQSLAERIKALVEDSAMSAFEKNQGPVNPPPTDTVSLYTTKILSEMSEKTDRLQPVANLESIEQADDPIVPAPLGTASRNDESVIELRTLSQDRSQSMNRLIEDSLTSASRAAADIVPDSVETLNEVVPRLAEESGREILQRYFVAVDCAAQALSKLPASKPLGVVPATVIYRLLRRDVAQLAWVAPSADGLGVLTALVDRLRGLVGGLPQECVQVRRTPDEHRLNSFLKSILDLEYEQQHQASLLRTMHTLRLSSADMAKLTGTTPEEVDEWLSLGPPVEYSPKVAAMTSISDILRHHLREGKPADVARRTADVYDGRSMLEVIADDEHEWLLESVRKDFDYSGIGGTC